MNLKWKGILSGFLTAIITAIIALLTGYLFPVLGLSHLLVLGGLFLGGMIAIYVAKSKTIKETVVIGSSVGLISSTFYLIILLLIPIIATPLIRTMPFPQAPFPEPQAFLMEKITGGTLKPTIIDPLSIIGAVAEAVLLLTIVSLIGSLSYYLISSLKK